MKSPNAFFVFVFYEARNDVRRAALRKVSLDAIMQREPPTSATVHSATLIGFHTNFERSRVVTLVWVVGSPRRSSQSLILFLIVFVDVLVRHR